MSARKIILFISVILFLWFVFFSYLVSKETFTQLDFDTTVKFQDHISRRWDLSFSFLSIIGSAEVTSFIWLGLMILALVKKYWLTLLALPLFFISVAVEIFGKIFVHHPGPPFLLYRGVINFNFPSHFVQTNYSYPSGHMTRISFLASFFAILIYLKLKSPLKYLFILALVGFVIAMIVSRIYLGEHWTSDVLGGLFLGSSLGIFTAITIPKNKPSSLKQNLESLV